MAQLESCDRRAVLARCLAAFGALRAVPAAAARQAPPVGTGTRPRAFWVGIVDSGFAVPQGMAPLDLLLELGGHFGNPDPVLRDRCGYGIPARWVVREKRLANDQLRRLADAWLGGLGAADDPSGGDPVLRRSFSALGLSLVVAADLGQRALDAAAVEALVARGSRQLLTNTDRRGFEPGVGWVHVTAHTADLLKFLGRHPLLTAPQQRQLLEALAAAVTSSPTVFQWGEDERLSRAAASVLRRDDADPRAVEGFLDTLQQVGSRVDWDQPLANGGVGPALNAKAVLKDLHLVMSVAGKDDRRQQVLRRLEALP